jgi:hypothetical protein
MLIGIFNANIWEESKYLSLKVNWVLEYLCYHSTEALGPTILFRAFGTTA